MVVEDVMSSSLSTFAREIAASEHWLSPAGLLTELDVSSWGDSRRDRRRESVLCISNWSPRRPGRQGVRRRVEALDDRSASRPPDRPDRFGQH